jgi:streptogrisin B
MVPTLVNMRKLLFGVVAVAAAIPFVPIATAHADGMLAVGSKITIGGRHDCSIGFFATDSTGDQLAVTAGHCADSLNETVTNAWGQQIGEVVAWQPDHENAKGMLDGARGVTVIYTYKSFGYQAFFTGTGTPSVGEQVRKFGETTSGTNGTITQVWTHPDNPTLDLMESDLQARPGDSGCAWYTLGSPVLLGIDSSGDEQNGVAGVYAQPLSSITWQMRNVRRYGQGFSVYVES